MVNTFEINWTEEQWALNEQPGEKVDVDSLSDATKGEEIEV